MRARRTGFIAIAAVLTLAALVAVIGAAQAAPSTKIYDATVRVVAGPATTLQLKLTNAAGSKQTLGSANFTAPAGVTNVTVVAGSVAGDGAFTVTSEGNVVKFRSTVPLKRTESVSANVSVTTTASCGDATWTAQAKQSNDFSGAGNDFTPGSSTNLRPLGSLAIADIGTEVDDPNASEDLFVPQIIVSVEEPLAVAAKDICGAPYANYGRSGTFGASATLTRKPATPPRLVNATLTQPAWTSGTGAGAGTGTAALTPVDVETGDHLVLSDQFTPITTESNEFDVVEKLCTSLDTTCEWANANGKIHAQAPGPPPAEEGEPVPNLGIGFNSDLNFDCEGDTTPIGGTLIYINPRDYPADGTVTVTLTYDKSIAGTGPASAHSLCLSKDNGLTWTFASPVPACPSDTPAVDDAPCIIEQKKTNGGDLLVVLFLKAADPIGGMS
jgi:hypothetical protein